MGFFVVLLCILVPSLVCNKIRKSCLEKHAMGVPTPEIIQKDLMVYIFTKPALYTWLLILLVATRTTLYFFGKDWSTLRLNAVFLQPVLICLFLRIREVRDIRANRYHITQGTVQETGVERIPSSDPDSSDTISAYADIAVEEENFDANRNYVSRQPTQSRVYLDESVYDLLEDGDTVYKVYLKGGCILTYHHPSLTKGKHSSNMGGNDYWHCRCGRTHPRNVSSCPCGLSKWEQT